MVIDLAGVQDTTRQTSEAEPQNRSLGSSRVINFMQLCIVMYIHLGTLYMLHTLSNN